MSGAWLVTLTRREGGRSWRADARTVRHHAGAPEALRAACRRHWPGIVAADVVTFLGAQGEEAAAAAVAAGTGAGQNSASTPSTMRSRSSDSAIPP